MFEIVSRLYGLYYISLEKYDIDRMHCSGGFCMPILELSWHSKGQYWRILGGYRSMGIQVL